MARSARHVGDAGPDAVGNVGAPVKQKLVVEKPR